jgi:hypothetical protein
VTLNFACRVHSRAVRALLGDPPPLLADHQRDLAFVVELLRHARAHQRLSRADERAGRAEEHAGIFRLLAAVFVFLVAIGVVHPDAEDLFRVEQRAQQRDGRKRDIGRCRSCLAEFAESAGTQNIDQARVWQASPEVDNAAAHHGAVTHPAAG